MKFDAIDIERRRVRIKSVLQAKQRNNLHTVRTPWEERIIQAQELTPARRADEKVEAFAAGARAAYLHWLEQRAARIEELRARLETGTYRVDSTTLAKDMLRKAAFDPENE
jgi:anti-sigma28 factor (negative regulator of flagellin synthesis)